MAIILSMMSRNLAGKVIADSIDSGSIVQNGYIEIRDGSRPVATEASPTGTNVLLVLNFSLPSFGIFNNGVALSNSIPNATVMKTGVAKWFRIYNRDKKAIIDGDVKKTGSGGDIEFDNINFIVGGTVSISSIRLDLFSNKCP